MESVIYSILSFAEYLLSEFWLPVSIWTVIAFTLLIGVKRFPTIHPQYHYQLRLAALLSLPAGVILLLILQGFELLLSSGTSEIYNLKLLTVSAPLEIDVAEAAGGALLSPYDIFLLIFITVFIAGITFYLLSFLFQWTWLKRFRNESALQDIAHLDFLNESNKVLIKSINKRIRFGFVNREIIPVTFGTKDPIVLVPESLKVSPGKLNLAIRHELIHISKNDFLSHVAVLVTQAMFWFHPLVYQLKNEIVVYRELRCDSALLSEKTISPKLYAGLLLELIPVSNLHKNIPVNMAQESSNLKMRIEMITNKTIHASTPKRRYFALFSCIFLSAALVMACTDMQIDNVYDEEDLEIMTNIDRSGEHGFHEIIIFMSEENQADKHESRLAKIEEMGPEHIESISVLKGDVAVAEYGSRGEEGVLIIKTKGNSVSFNSTMETLGLNTIPEEEFSGNSERNDFYVVVEEMPELVGGLAQLQQSIQYPEAARQAGIEGRVHIQFIVTEQGNVENAQVVRGIGAGIDEEALRVISQAKFTPGYQRGKPVRVQYALPIFFRLAKDDASADNS